MRRNRKGNDTSRKNATVSVAVVVRARVTERETRGGSPRRADGGLELGEDARRERVAWLGAANPEWESALENGVRGMRSMESRWGRG